MSTNTREAGEGEKLALLLDATRKNIDRFKALSVLTKLNESDLFVALVSLGENHLLSALPKFKCIAKKNDRIVSSWETVDLALLQLKANEMLVSGISDSYEIVRIDDRSATEGVLSRDSATENKGKFGTAADLEHLWKKYIDYLKHTSPGLAAMLLPAYVKYKDIFKMPHAVNVVFPKKFMLDAFMEERKAVELRHSFSNFSKQNAFVECISEEVGGA